MYTRANFANFCYYDGCCFDVNREIRGKFTILITGNILYCNEEVLLLSNSKISGCL